MKFLDQLKSHLLAWGLPGLFVLSFLDSAGVPIPGGPDATVMVLSWRYPAQVLPIVLAATLGSTLGCLFLYQVGRKGGEVALARFKPERREWVKEKLDRNAFWVIMMAVAAPPPFPTKLFILGAGVMKIGRGRFIAGVLSGRLLRYLAEAYLGIHFGEGAADALEEQYPVILLAGFLIIIALALVYWLRQRNRPGVDVKASMQRDS